MSRDSRRHTLSARTRSRRLSANDSPSRGGNLFAWTIAILLLAGLAIGCWIFSFYVFNHPEKPVSYAVLTKLKKLESPKRFKLTAAPRGDFLNAKKLWDRYGSLSDPELRMASETLLRDYLRNYKLTREKVPYLIGSYLILDSWELGGENFFVSGVVALAQSPTVPEVLIEQVFPAETKVIPDLQRMLLTGLDLHLDRRIDLSALIGVRRLGDGRLLFTAVPLLYGAYASTTGPDTFSLSPPQNLQVAAGLPILDTNRIAEADEKIATYRFRSGVKTPDGQPAKMPPRQTLMRVERPEPVNGAAPAPVPEPSPAHTPLPPDAPVRVAVPVNPLPGQPVVTASVEPGETPLEPFLSPSPSPSPTATPDGATSGSQWPTYAPGKMPRGRLLNIPDMPELATRGTSGDRIYLQGDFVVTASGQNRAVLRAQGAMSETLGLGGRNSNTRVIVEFPAGDRPPSEGSTFSRDLRRPFLITNIRKGSDGQVNVYVREVTRAQ